MKPVASLAMAACVVVQPACAADRPLETRLAWSPLCLEESEAGLANRGVFLGAVVAALAPKLIGGAVDAAATALKKAGERAEVARSSAKTISRPYAVSKDADLGLTPEHGCLVIARGEFPAQDGAPKRDATGLEQLGGIKDPVLIFEAKVKMLAGEPFFQLVPYRLRVGKFEGSSFFSAKEREYAIAVSLSSPGADKPFASTTFTFAGIPEGADLKSGSWQLAGKGSAPLPLPPVPDSSKKAQAKQEGFLAPYVLAGAVLSAKAKPEPPRVEPAPNPYQSAPVRAAIDELCRQAKAFNKEFPKSPVNEAQCGYHLVVARAEVDKKVQAAQSPDALLGWANKVCPRPVEVAGGGLSCDQDLERPIAAKARFGYMVTDATIVETRPGSKFAAYLAEALGGAKEDLTKAIAQQVVPSQVKAADAAEDAADRSARRSVVLSDLAVTQAEQALAELQASTPAPSPSSVTAARASLIKAKIAANDAHRAANLPVPFPELD